MPRLLELPAHLPCPTPLCLWPSRLCAARARASSRPHRRPRRSQACSSCPRCLAGAAYLQQLGAERGHAALPPGSHAAAAGTSLYRHGAGSRHRPRLHPAAGAATRGPGLLGCSCCWLSLLPVLLGAGLHGVPNAAAVGAACSSPSELRSDPRPLPAVSVLLPERGAAAASLPAARQQQPAVPGALPRGRRPHAAARLCQRGGRGRHAAGGGATLGCGRHPAREMFGWPWFTRPCMLARALLGCLAACHPACCTQWTAVLPTNIVPLACRNRQPQCAGPSAGAAPQRHHPVAELR